MALSTYEQLQSAITGLLHRDNLDAAVPDFIRLAEAEFNRELRCRQMETRVTAQSSDRYLTLPDDFLELRNIKVLTTPYRQLVNISTENLDTYYDSASSGCPRAYAMVGESIYVSPPPDGTYTYEIDYYASVPALETFSSNWLLIGYPDAYLYGSLLHSAPYLRDDARLATWGTFYTSVMASIRRADANARWGGNALQMRTDNPVV